MDHNYQIIWGILCVPLGLCCTKSLQELLQQQLNTCASILYKAVATVASTVLLLSAVKGPAGKMAAGRSAIWCTGAR